MICVFSIYYFIFIQSAHTSEQVMSYSDFLETFENIEPGLLIFDDKMLVRHANNTFIRHFPMFGRNEIIGKNIIELHKDPAKNRITSMLEIMDRNENQMVTQIKVDMANNGDKYYLIKLNNLISDGDRRCYCLLSYDITSMLTTKNRKLTKMPTQLGSDIHFIELNKILYFAADNIYTKFYTKTKEHYSFFMISEIEEKLPEDTFIRIHRSFIINVNYIEKVVKRDGSFYVILKFTGAELSVSRSRVKTFLDIMGLK